MTQIIPTPPRETVFVTHAAPEDNEFALWISSKLATAGYRVWVDRRRLRGGDDFWDEIDQVLRTEAIKQVIVFSQSVRKPGVKKELAIGEIMKQRLSDPKFMIPVRIDDVDFSNAPPEFLRGNILNGYPNWHDCLKDLFDSLEAANVPRAISPDAAILHSIVDAREDGRRFVVDRAEDALTNWFPISPPESIRYFKFEGLQDQLRDWIGDCTVPIVQIGRLAGSFTDLPAFSASSSFSQKIETAYDIPFTDFVAGTNLGPYQERSSATSDVANLLRQHFSAAARANGLKPFQFANKEVGWYFPDDLVPSNRIIFTTPSGRRIRRTMSGKFKKLRWHLCLQAKPRVWPTLVYRVHGNIVLSENGVVLAGEKTHIRRRRLTRSWWNNVWRDRLLAAMHYLTNGDKLVALKAENVLFSMSSWPIVAQLPVSYDAIDPPLPSEEDDEGNITPTATLDEYLEEFEPDEGDESENSL